MKIKGIDISKHQGSLSDSVFNNIVAHTDIEFIILRVGFTGYSNYKPTIDPKFNDYYNKAHKANIPIGVYYYSLATNELQAEEEAKFVLEQIKNKQINYPVYIDMEDSKWRQYKQSKSTLAKVCNKWCDIINNAGYNAGVYASTSWFNNKIGSITSKHTKWVAQYNTSCLYKGTYDMWQYTSSGKVEGISTKVDMNYCYKDFNSDKSANSTVKNTTKKKYNGTIPTLPTRGYFKKGDKGTQVKYVQKFLNWYGSYELEIDGSFGNATQTAVKKWQKSQGLKADGCFGKASIAKMKTVTK